MILIIEDEKTVSDLLKYHLEYAGMEVETVFDGLSGIEVVKRRGYELVLLDLMLPGADGYEVLEVINRKNIPVIIVSAMDGTTDRVKGLDLGADDYICKPFEGLELLARIRAVLRRRSPLKTNIKFDTFEINFHEKRVFTESGEAELTPREFDLLEFLADHPGMIMSRDLILDKVWGIDSVIDTRTVDIHINKLRSKLQTEVIKTVYKRGYRLEWLP